MSRVIRYQGAILHHHQLLLIKHREHASGHSYWVIPVHHAPLAATSATGPGLFLSWSRGVRAAWE